MFICVYVEDWETHILLHRSAAYCNEGCNEASGINTNIGYCANTNTQQNNCYA